MAGFAVGIFSVTAILYVAEISSPKNRGLVGATAILFSYLGVFAINLCGYLFEITAILSIMVTLPIGFLVTIHYWMIESPFYLFQKGTVRDALTDVMIIEFSNFCISIKWINLNSQ